MNQRIIYPTDDGVAIIIPTESIELAMKDIPEGKPYQIVDVAGTDINGKTSVTICLYDQCVVY